MEARACSLLSVQISKSTCSLPLPGPCLSAPFRCAPEVRHPLGVCRGTRVVDSLGRLGTGVKMERPWRRNLLSLPSWVAPRETAQFRCWSVHLHSSSTSLLTLPPPWPAWPPGASAPGPPLLPCWGVGQLENIHVDPTAVRGERLQWCGAWRIGKERVLVKSCHRPVYPGYHVATPHELNRAGEVESGHWVPRGRSSAGVSAAE